MVVRKLAVELAVGDTVAEIDSIRTPPVAFETGGKTVIHSARVVRLERITEQPEVFDVAAHNQEGYNRLAEANAEPNAEKSFPAIQVTLAGYENDKKLDHEAVYLVRALALVEVIDAGTKTLRGLL